MQQNVALVMNPEIVGFARRSVGGRGRRRLFVRIDSPLRVLITGAGSGVGRACAELLSGRGAELILCDIDAKALREVTERLSSIGRFCDVASEASVAILAAEIVDDFRSLDMVINAAGGGYERTLGMYRVSRALIPALRRGIHYKRLINVPPEEDSAMSIFSYASSAQAFHRLSAALADETRGTGIAVLIGCPKSSSVTQVLPGANAARAIETGELRGGEQDNVGALASQVAALAGPACWDNVAGSRRRTG